MSQKLSWDLHSQLQGWSGPLLQLQKVLCCIAKSENMKVSIKVLVAVLC